MKKVSDIKNFVIIACRKLMHLVSSTFNSTSSIRVARFIKYSFIGLVFVVLSCKTAGDKRVLDTPTSGNIKISADESFMPVIDSEVYTFTHLYKNAKITPSYKPEYDVIADLMNDSVKTIVTSKKLTDEQVQLLRDSLVIARTTTFAYDALAFIINKDNYDSLLKYNTIKDIFLGNISKWSEINKKSNLGNIRVIFDNNKSGNVRYFREKFELIDSLPSNFYALSTNKEVVDFVSRNKDAIGVISVNWISDRDDSASVSFVKKIRVVGVTQENLDQSIYYRPEQGWIYDKTYPFTREIFFITRETYKGLGSGLIFWACLEQGQRIVLKIGLVPATMPIRVVQISNQ
jgi:phosphate transport system substrate-binding protein